MTGANGFIKAICYVRIKKRKSDLLFLVLEIKNECASTVSIVWLLKNI